MAGQKNGTEPQWQGGGRALGRMKAKIASGFSGYGSCSLVWEVPRYYIKKISKIES